ncbi:MAG TPA: hypothetical protein VF292_11285 [Rhodanobacteraceae bacterium]
MGKRREVLFEGVDRKVVGIVREVPRNAVGRRRQEAAPFDLEMP